VVDTANFTAWASALSALERELEWARDLGRETGSSWSAPAELGTIPPELLDRARAILAAQQETSARLYAHHGATGRHLAALRTVPPGRNERSAYLDVAG
jgi:hypothetical protein